MWTGPPPRRRRSWQLVLVVLAAVVVLTIGFVIMLRPLMAQHDDAAPGSTSPTEVAWAPPVPLTGNRSFVSTTVTDSGDLQVTHWIHSRIALFDVTLEVPRLGRNGPAMSAGEVQVVADGRPVTGADSVGRTSQSYQLYGASRVLISYVLSGAVEASPSEAGRALARVTSLDVAYATVRGTSTRSVEGVPVLSMACTPIADFDAVPTPCGEPQGDTWQVELKGEDRSDRVMAQLELP